MRLFDDPRVVEGYFERSPSDTWIRLFSEICSPVPKQRLVDFGCGSGVFGRALKHRCGFKQLILVDSSPEVVACLKRDVTDTNEYIIQTHATPWQCSDGPIDFLLIKSVLHHTPDYPALLAHLSKQLSSKGQIAIQSRTREQFLTTIELEFFLTDYPVLRGTLALRFPLFEEVCHHLRHIGLSVFTYSYVDIIRTTPNRHLDRLRRRSGNSIFWELTEGQHARLLDTARMRYQDQADLIFTIPMTVWVGMRHS